MTLTRPDIRQVYLDAFVTKWTELMGEPPSEEIIQQQRDGLDGANQGPLFHLARTLTDAEWRQFEAENWAWAMGGGKGPDPTEVWRSRC